MTRRTLSTGPGTPPGGVARYRDRIFDAKQHDPYQAAGKYPEPTHCGTCGAVFHRGRWQWASAPQGGHVAACPACRRIGDKLPAGTVTLEGPFVREHRDDLVRLIHNEAEREREEHPMHHRSGVLQTEPRHLGWDRSRSCRPCRHTCRSRRCNRRRRPWVAAGHREDEGAPIDSGRRIDFCFVSPALAARVQSRRIDAGAVGSDHQPVWISRK